MPTKYFCAHCDQEFVPEGADTKPRCPQCMRRGGVEPVRDLAPRERVRRPWLLAIAGLIVASGLGLGFYLATVTRLEDTPPLRPLEQSELSAYLERDQIRVASYEPMMMLSGSVEGWPATPAEIAAQMHSRTSSWSLEHPLTREVLTADQTLAAIQTDGERRRVYPLELATAMVALLREKGTKAMVAEAWEFEGAGAPADPSGILGYFVTAVYEAPGSEEPSAYFDPWGGRGEADLRSVRVLRDTEVLAAALGTEASRLFSRSGDAGEALPMVETALLLDPLSPTLRAVSATILIDSGGLTEAVQEFEAAVALRPDGPRKLNLVQLYLAQAGILEMNGEPGAAEAQFGEASRLVSEVVEGWPRFGRAHAVLATIYLGEDEPERARVELEAAAALSPDAPMLWAIWAQYDLAQSEPAPAAVKIARAVSLDPENWQLRLQAARILQGAGDDEGAQENLAVAMQMVPPEKRAEVRGFIERMMGPASVRLPSEEEGAPPPPSESDSSDDPALMLGDPSKLRLRDPGESLQLDLDE